MNLANPVLTAYPYAGHVAIEHIQSGCLVGMVRTEQDAASYRRMIRPYLRGVRRFEDLHGLKRVSMIIRLTNWLAAHNYPPYTHCPECGQWATLCEGH